MSRATAAKMGACRMCSKMAPLEESHVVPSFVVRWLKETAATPYIRTGENPNLRVQDLWRRRWFCRACEDHIGRFEKAFAEELFPRVVTERPMPYRHGPWLSRFIASVAWRTVLFYSERGESFDLFMPGQKTLLPQALEHWRAFVRGEADTPGIHELHFIPMGVFADYQGDRTLPPNINRYILRAVEVNVVAHTREAFVYVKMGPAVALSFIQPPPPDTWVGTYVALGDGQVGGRMVLPVQFLDYLIERAKKVRASLRGRSARQKDKVRQALEADLDRATASETFRAIDADVAQFGIERVFSSDDEAETGRTK